MKNSRKFTAIGVGALMTIGSMVAFAAPAHAVTGELTVGPLSGNESYVDVGTGTIEVRGGGFGTGWFTPDVDLTEAPGSCFDIGINVPGSTIIPSGSNATQILAGGATIGIDGNACGFTNGICVLSLTSGIALTSTNWVNGATAYTGTFRDNGITQVGGFTITNVNNCAASGLQDWIYNTLMGGGSGTSGTSTNLLDVEFNNRIDK